MPPPQMIADHIKGVGMKTAKEIKDYQMSLTGERFKSLDQLKNIGRVDWDSYFCKPYPGVKWKYVR